MTVSEYIKSDYMRYGYSTSSFIMWVSGIFCLRRPFGYTFWYRLASERNMARGLARIRLKFLSRRYGVEIPPSCKIGPGLYIGHAVGIILNPTTVIGSNCNLSQLTTIGSNHGQAASIGDNVYIGPGVSIVEAVSIGNNATIGAGSVITRNVPEDATVVGVPGRVINYNNPARYISRRWVS